LATRYIGLWGIVLWFFLSSAPASGIELKLVDTPFSQVIELYSRETGKNVFLDETIQKNRPVTAHLPGMGIEEAFEVIKSMMGVQSCRIGDKGVLLFPPERANLYTMEMKPAVLMMPKGVDANWLIGLISSVAPNAKVAPQAKDGRTLVLFGPDEQLEKAKALVRKFSNLGTVERNQKMNEAEAKLAKQELGVEEVDVEPAQAGLVWRGKKEAVEEFGTRLSQWRRSICWGQDIFTPKHIDAQRFLKAIEATKGRVIITELGGTGSILIEGPMDDHFRVMAVLKTLGENARPRRQEVALWELRLEAEQQVIKGSGLKVEGYGDNHMVLVGEERALEDTTKTLKLPRKKNRQVLVRFRLAEIVKGRLKNLGIELDKSAYAYDEIKAFHPRTPCRYCCKSWTKGSMPKPLPSRMCG